ncbi:MAG: hypothetical protein V1727_03700 [Candidatus Omnitrophota bacterium]
MCKKPLPVITILAVLFLSWPKSCYTAPSNGSHLPPKGHTEAGLEYRRTQERQLRHSHGTLRSNNYFYTISIGVLDWLALDGKIGAGDILHKGGPLDPYINYQTGFAGGYGFRIKALEDKEKALRLITGFQHISVHPQDERANTYKSEAVMDDWQWTTLLVKDCAHFSAYIGAKFSDGQIVFRVNEGDPKRFYSRHHAGVVGGIDFYLFEDRVRLNLEGLFIDETAFSATITYLY